MRRLLRALLPTIAALAAGAAEAQMKVHVIDVGQAESILLEFPTAALLIDAGGEDTGDNRDRDHLIGYLDRFFQRRTDLNRTLHGVIVSHPHIDHTKHLGAVLRAFTVRNFADGGDERGSGIDSLRVARALVRRNGVNRTIVRDGRVRLSGYRPLWLARLERDSDVDVRFLSGSRPACEDENNSSLVVRVEYREATFLFTGDAEGEDRDCTPLLHRLVSRFRDRLLDVDVYKVGHHASDNGTTTDLLTFTTPEIAVISAGIHTTRVPGRFHGFFFGHPREQAVAMIERAISGTRPNRAVFTMDAVRQVREPRSMSKAVYCTCWDGDVVIDVDATGRTLTVQPSQD
jgi:beta-lactamase superfamily II metal-dependent hydrolase